MTPFGSRRLLWSIAIGIGFALCALLVSWTEIDRRLNNQTALGIFYGIRGAALPPAHASVIGIDRATVDWLRAMGVDREVVSPPAEDCVARIPPEDLIAVRGPNSIPRSVYACLIDRLKAFGFPVIALDVLFSVRGDPAEDLALARAIRFHGAAVILVGLERSTVASGRAELLVERELQPFVSFAGNAASTGTFVVTRTGGPVYGYWRRVPGFQRIRSLPDETFRLFLKKIPAVADEPGELPSFQHFWLYGTPGAITTIPALEVLRADADMSRFADAPGRAAFVGASDPSVAAFPDTFPSFFRGVSGAEISGVELAATAFLNRLPAQSLRRLSPETAGLVVAAFGFIAGFVAYVRTGLALTFLPLSAVLVMSVGAFAFVRGQILLPVGTPVFIVAPAAFVTAVFVRYRLARAIVLRLAPETVARRMLSRGSDARSAPVSGEATVAFFDLIGSTAIAENLSPVEFSTLLNTYHDVVASAVRRHKGAVIAFSGDGVMAAFQRTDAGVAHADLACRAALQVVAEIGASNDKNRPARLPPVHVRVGINSGVVAEGEIGAQERFNFSVVGDVVNLASRLEQLGKTLFPGEKDVILVGGASRQGATGTDLTFTDCGNQEIRGREHPEAVYRLLVD